MQYFVYHFQVFLLIMTRMTAMMTVAPFYSSGGIPLQMRAILAFLITVVIFPVVAATGKDLPGSMGGYYVLLIQEVAIGLYIGFLISVIFAAFQLAGDFFAVQIGFGINEVLDPIGQITVPLVGQFKNLIGLLVLLSMNGHHLIIQAVYRSYELAPYIGIHKSAAGGLLKYMLYAFSGMFVVALKIALPVLAVIFLVTVSEGVLAKVAPQMNIMMLGFPIKIVVAFAVLILSTPLIVRIMQVSLERVLKFVNNILRYWPT